MLTAFREWFLSVAPVAMYLFAERTFATMHSRIPYLSSAEWGIATVFIALGVLQLLFLDMNGLDTKRYAYDRNSAFLIMCLSFITALLALIFSVKILTLQNTEGAQAQMLPWVRLQWVFLVLASAVFLWIRVLSLRYARSSDTGER